jgi:hypothetical protein
VQRGWVQAWTSATRAAGQLGGTTALVRQPGRGRVPGMLHEQAGGKEIARPVVASGLAAWADSAV